MLKSFVKKKKKKKNDNDFCVDAQCKLFALLFTGNLSSQEGNMTEPSAQHETTTTTDLTSPHA